MSLNISLLILPMSFIVGGILAGLIFDKVMLTKLNKIAEKTKWEGYKIIISAISGMTLFWFVIAGSYGAIANISIPPETRAFFTKCLLVVIIFSVTIVAARISAGFVSIYSKNVEGIFPSITIFTNITKLFVFIIGILIALQSVGISITPILTALGVGGLAVALALQDTLANLFAGLHIIASKQIRQGDYIKLASGEEGYVTDITWRNTAIKTLANNIIIVPNSKAAAAIITNYYLPDKLFSFSVTVLISYENDLKKIEKITTEAAKEIVKKNSNVVNFEPLISFHSFTESGINLNIIFKVNEFADQYCLKHEFIKELHQRYKDEMVIFPPLSKTFYFKES